MSTLEQLIVHPDADGRIGVACGCGDDDALCAGGEVLACALTVAKDTGALHHDVDFEFGPGKLGRVALCAGADPPSIDLQATLNRLNFAGEATVHGVVGEEVGEGTVVSQVIDVHELDVIIVQCSTEYVSTDASKTVEGDSCSHDSNSLEKMLKAQSNSDDD